MTTSVYVGLGSNLERERMIGAAVTALRREYGAVDLSPFYDCASVGFDGSDFLNGVAAFASDRAAEDLVANFHAIEDRLGRDRSLPKFASRPIDLDLLLYGDAIVDAPPLRLPRPEILEYAFVLRPLADLAPDLVHPEAGETMAVLWQRMAPTAPRLTPYPLDLD